MHITNEINAEIMSIVDFIKVEFDDTIDDTCTHITDYGLIKLFGKKYVYFYEYLLKNKSFQYVGYGLEPLNDYVDITLNYIKYKRKLKLKELI